MAGRRLTAIRVGVKEAPEGSQCDNRHCGWRRDQLRPTARICLRHPLRDLCPGAVRKDDDKAALAAPHVAPADLQLTAVQRVPRITDGRSPTW